MTRKLAIGGRVVYDDEDCTIEALSGGHVRLRTDTGELWAVSAAAVLAAPTSTTTSQREPDPEPVLDGIDEQLVELAFDRAAHIREYTTGYRSGAADDALEHEPRPEYDPTAVRSLGAREATKAAELGVTAKTLRNWRAAFEDRGVYGLIDHRSTRQYHPLAGIDERIIAAAIAVAERSTDESTGTRKRFVRRMRAHLEASEGLGRDDLPSDRVLSRVARVVTAGRYTFDKATTRRSKAVVRPKSVSGFWASRAGQIVLMDSTPLDVMLLDPETGVRRRVELIMAVDAYTRAILAWRFVPTVNRVDASLLLADLLNPLEMRPNWEESVRYSMLQVPANAIEADERLALAACRPLIVPETILVDNARINISRDFRAACERAQISLHYARVALGTDKPIVERTFRTIGTLFSQHAAGFTGSNVAERGRDVDGDAAWLPAQIEELFAEWVVHVQLRRQVRTLVLPMAPDLSLTPIEAYNQSVAQCGYITVPDHRDLYFDLLPTKWVTISSNCVTVNTLTYSGDALVGLNGATSSYQREKGKWPVRYDPRDRLHVYIQVDGRWQQLRWVHAGSEFAPFTDRTLEFAKSLVRDREGRRGREDEVATALERIQNGLDVPRHTAKRIQNRMSRDAARAREVERDRRRGGMEESPVRLVPPAPADEPDDEEAWADLEPYPLAEEEL